MYFRIGALLALAGLALLPRAASAEPRWIKARLGSFEAISDDGRTPATQALSQFEQFSFALGSVMGQPELRLDPPLRILVFRTARELQEQCPPGLPMGRDRRMACTTSSGQLPRSLLRDLTRLLLDTNFSRMPAPFEKALETFFSTVESNAVHVTWGAPPPPAERTREWALVHRIVTQPEYAARARVYLHNLSTGMDAHAASRNAFAEDAPMFDAEVDRYFAAGIFNTSAAPNRPLNPDRDFTTTALTSDEGQLMRADLLTSGSAAIYQSLLNAGKHVSEANEGLALLAMRNGDTEKARSFMEAARKAGTRNFVLLTAYAGIEKDSARAIGILKEALTLDPNYAQAHWNLGEKLSDPARRMAEWKQAVNLAPRNHEWWAQYAQLCLSQKQYAEAGRAWMAAAQAAPDVQLREQYLSARGQIDQLRLDAEDAERRKDAEAKAREIDRLKSEARRELADLEARVNTRPLTKEEAARTVDWFEAAPAGKISGTLLRVDCIGKQLRLNLKDDEGKTRVLLVPDPALFALSGAQTLSCGAQRPRRATVSYKPAKQGSPKDLAGEATEMEFQP